MTAHDGAGCSTNTRLRRIDERRDHPSFSVFLVLSGLFCVLVLLPELTNRRRSVLVVAPPRAYLAVQVIVLDREEGSGDIPPPVTGQEENWPWKSRAVTKTSRG